MGDRTAHYFDREPDSPHRQGHFEATWEGVAFKFETDSAVFSRHRLDPGTDLLVRTVLIETANRPGRLLDLGTGVGVMAIALARLRPDLEVTASDINRRAIELASKNARAMGVGDRISLVTCDGVPKGLYDLVVTNPPIRAGKATVYRLFREAASNLAADGSLLAVIRVKQGAASARRELETLFDEVVTLARSKGYHVLRARHVREAGGPGGGS